MRKDDVSYIERLLVYLGLSEQTMSWASADPMYVRPQDKEAAIISLKTFDGAEPLEHSILENARAEGLLKSHRRSWFLFDDERIPSKAEMEELAALDLGNWRVSMVFSPKWTSGDTGYKSNKIPVADFRSTRKIKLSEIRQWSSILRLTTGDVWEDCIATVFNDGTYHAQRVLMERRGIHFWVIAFPFPVKPYLYGSVEGEVEEASAHFLMLKSAALTNYYEWRVSFGWNTWNLPTVSMPCDPVTHKSAFKMRAIPAGKSRREALRHWVAGYLRTAGEGKEESYKVWPYLRGATKFSYEGLDCLITPSEHDMKKLACYQQESASAKSKRGRTASARF